MKRKTGESVDTTPILKQSELFTDLGNAELASLSASSELLSFEADEVIVSGAPIAGRVYMVRSGDISIARSDGHHVQSILARFIGGECFGELDLFSETGPPVTVIAETECEVMVFPRGDLSVDEVFAKHASSGANVLRNLLTMVAQRIRSTNNLISQRSPWVEELKKLVHVDKLTGLRNKTWLYEELPHNLADRRAGSAILIVKPDKFKTINDTYGHDAGDQALSLFAETIAELAASSGTAVRHGGDVFAIVHKNGNRRQIKALAARTLLEFKRIDLGPITEPDELVMTVSVGVEVRAPNANKTVGESVDSAFASMLTARESGGDRIDWGDDG